MNLKQICPLKELEIEGYQDLHTFYAFHGCRYQYLRCISRQWDNKMATKVTLLISACDFDVVFHNSFSCLVAETKVMFTCP